MQKITTKNISSFCLQPRLLKLAVGLPLVDLLLCSFSCTFDPHYLCLFAAFFIPSHLSLISPSSLLFLTSCLPNLFSLMSMLPVSRSVYFVTVYLPSLLSLITHSPLVSPCLLPPLRGVSVPDRVQHSNHRFIKVSQCRFVRSLLNNCPGKGANNSTYRTWSAALTRSCFSLYTSAKQTLTVAQRV